MSEKMDDEMNKETKYLDPSIYINSCYPFSDAKKNWSSIEHCHSQFGDMYSVDLQALSDDFVRK